MATSTVPARTLNATGWSARDAGAGSPGSCSPEIRFGSTPCLRPRASATTRDGRLFARRYGFDHPVQWEVEALEPDELQRLVLTAVDPYVDREVLAEQMDREEQQRRALFDFLGGWGAAGGTSA